MAIVHRYTNAEENVFADVECNDTTYVMERVIYSNNSNKNKTITIANAVTSWSYVMVAGTSGTETIPAGFVGAAQTTEEEGIIITSGSLQIGES